MENGYHPNRNRFHQKMRLKMTNRNFEIIEHFILQFTEKEYRLFHKFDFDFVSFLFDRIK